jgi:hypothetical protein
MRHVIRGPVCRAFPFLLLVTFASAGFAFPLAKDGKPQATIVVAKAATQPAKDDDAAKKVQTAAADLQQYVRKISGAELPIVADDARPEGPLVLVGRSRLTDEMHIEIPSGLTPARQEEGFVVRAAGDRLLLAGNDAGPYHGTEYATYDLLERLGVRWFMPGEFGEIVPTRATIDVPDLDVRQKPDFIMRNWWIHASPDMLALEQRWKIRNRMNPDPIFDLPGDSSVRGFVADKELVKTKPELFAREQDGTVNPFLPNLSNPEAVKIAADRMKEGFRRRPGQNSIGIAPDDGMPRDFGKETSKRNQGFFDVGGREGVPAEASVSEEWIGFVNAVAREVAAEFPDRVITTNGYANRNTPPEGVPIEPNVGIMFAAIWSDTIHAYDDPRSWQMVRQGQMLKRWCELSDKVFIYGYNYTMLVSALTPVPLTRKLARDLPLVKQWGAIGFHDEARNQWAECGIPTKYLRARLEWDTHADVRALQDDFYARWYGPAAAPARRFWDDLEDAIERTPLLGHEDRILPYVYTPELMTKLAGGIAEAEKRAEEGKDDRRRLHVHVDRLIYEHLKAYMAMTHAEWAADWAEAARQADAMMAIRKQLMAISPFFCLDYERDDKEHPGYESGISYWGVVQRGKYYRKLAGLTDGTEGKLLAVLPEKALFQIDPADEGRFARWHDPAWNTDAWRHVLTTKPFYAQGYLSPEGYPYTGYAWYRFETDVPTTEPGQRVELLCPVVETEAWVWVNGQYVGHRPYKEAYERPNELRLDVTKAIKPGQKNLIAIRVSTGQSRAQAAGGLGSRAFLYSPKHAEAGNQ